MPNMAVLADAGALPRCTIFRSLGAFSAVAVTALPGPGPAAAVALKNDSELLALVHRCRLARDRTERSWEALFLAERRMAKVPTPEAFYIRPTDAADLAGLPAAEAEETAASDVERGLRSRLARRA